MTTQQSSSTLSTIASIALAILLGACGGTSPAVRFYALEVPAAAPLPADRPGYSVVVGPVTVPELVDRPHFVLRGSPGRVEIAEQARWAAPLKHEIPRVVAGHLGKLLDGARTATFAERAAGLPDYRVAIDIQRFESAPGDAAAVQAAWTVRPREGSAVTGLSSVSEPAGSGFDDLAAAHGRALAAVSRDIAAAIATLRTRP